MNSHGGFGFLTRKKAEEYSKLGHEVHVYVPRFAFDGHNQDDISLELNGVTVHFFKTPHNIFIQKGTSQKLKRLLATFNYRSWFPISLDNLTVDVFQAEDPFQPSILLSKQGVPHITVFQDPFDDIDFGVMKEAENEYLFGNPANPSFRTEDMVRTKYFEKRGTYYSKGRYLKRSLGGLVKNEKDSNLFSEADFISEKLISIFELKFKPLKLPNPIDVPDIIPPKFDKPTVVWLARWDPQKRVDVALKTARDIPEIDFYFIGTSSKHPTLIQRQQELIRAYRKFDNIHILDFVSEEVKRSIVSGSWILLNTSVREGLPISFLEAAAVGTAIVSSVNPDSYSSKYGAFVPKGNFITKIRELIKSEECFELGKKGHSYIKKTHETDVVMKEHIRLLNGVLNE